MIKSIHHLADEVIRQKGVFWLPQSKIQYLCFYCQAWSLAINKKRIVDCDFIAMKTGPVNHELYQRFNEAGKLYSGIEESDIVTGNDALKMSKEDRCSFNQVMEVYGFLDSGSLKRKLTSETPWCEAFSDAGNPSRVISDASMISFYGDMLK